METKSELYFFDEITFENELSQLRDNMKIAIEESNVSAGFGNKWTALNTVKLSPEALITSCDEK